MREILFRGKRIDNGEWVYGYVVKHGNRWWIYTGEIAFVEGCINEYGGTLTRGVKYVVDPETVCQYTGSIDCNRKKIFEDDFVRIDDEWNGRVVWRDDVTAFYVMPDDDINIETYCVGFYLTEMHKVEVIGNYYDNPKLLEVEE